MPLCPFSTMIATLSYVLIYICVDIYMFVCATLHVCMCVCESFSVHVRLVTRNYHKSITSGDVVMLISYVNKTCHSK